MLAVAPTTSRGRHGEIRNATRNVLVRFWRFASFRLFILHRISQRGVLGDALQKNAGKLYLITVEEILLGYDGFIGNHI